jgi:hypothetical protein
MFPDQHRSCLDWRIDAGGKAKLFQLLYVPLLEVKFCAACTARSKEHHRSNVIPPPRVTSAYPPSSVCGIAFTSSISKGTNRYRSVLAGMHQLLRTEPGHNCRGEARPVVDVGSPWMRASSNQLPFKLVLKEGLERPIPLIRSRGAGPFACPRLRKRNLRLPIGLAYDFVQIVW